MTITLVMITANTVNKTKPQQYRPSLFPFLPLGCCVFSVSGELAGTDTVEGCCVFSVSGELAGTDMVEGCCGPLGSS